MFHFLICDNDNFFCIKEERFIKDYYSKKDIEVSCDIYHSADEITELGGKTADYDAIFLDVSMGEVDGIDLGGWLKATAPGLVIVYVSGYMSYALDGYKVGAVRYIMKDEDKFGASMEECLNFLLQKAQEEEADKMIAIGKKNRVSADRILYVGSKGHKIIYRLAPQNGVEEEITIYGKLDDAENELFRHGFFRIHQSYLVNMNYVRSVKRYEALLLSGRSIRISKGRYDDVEEAFILKRGKF